MFVCRHLSMMPSVKEHAGAGSFGSSYTGTESLISGHDAKIHDIQNGSLGCVILLYL